MFRFFDAIKKQRFEEETKKINEEINRSRRHNYNFCVFVVEVSHSAPRGLSKILPGKVVSFHLFSKHIRSYDQMFGTSRRRYTIIFSQADRNGADAIEKRFYKLAAEYYWGALSIGIAVYPEDGKTAQELLEKAISEIS